jgi:hypothetical protein
VGGVVVIVFTVKAFAWQVQHRLRIAWQALRHGESYERGYVVGWMDHRHGRPRDSRVRRPPKRLAVVVPLHVGRHRAVEDDVRRQA